MSIFGHTKDVANKCIEWADRNMHWTWVTQDPGAPSSLEDFAGDTTGSVAQPNVADPNITVVCYEMMMLALLDGGWADRQGVLDIYKDLIAGSFKFKDLLAWGVGGGASPYAGTTPELGHLVSFNNLRHVAIATGTKDTSGRSEIISFWGGMDPLTPTGPTPNTPVMRDSIENINQVYFGGAATLQVGKPRWR